ncbi:hypothetical protein [Acidaminobacter hydrogenoformans]|uniref:Uncharacterized protein n=1 Tax=Acidaminobacter hydrogenoformans DSM 2784 TaxID=1120920 RepID=A0A1G5RX47_9FIRM|nr:hypothetical protein [Acidaminobacter hydrogenoformans]SCZ78320.1 hypothetical protein SAMN03080599_01207 [Acidaminobacter hydrogenoformans DSM 2784]
MRVIIDDRFFEFQNERTEQIFTEQKTYLKDMIEKYQNEGDMEALVTTLLSLSNLTEGLINEMVEEVGADQVASYLKAKEV